MTFKDRSRDYRNDLSFSKRVPMAMPFRVIFATIAGLLIMKIRKSWRALSLSGRTAF